MYHRVENTQRVEIENFPVVNVVAAATTLVVVVVAWWSLAAAVLLLNVATPIYDYIQTTQFDDNIDE